jgi:hypothetical protein
LRHDATEATIVPVMDWRDFERTRPDLAAAGQRLLYQFGVGLAFLATTTSDGAPRVHPICPILHDRGLYALIVPSPKQDDLHRDGRFAMHSFPCDDNEDAFYLAGVARPEADPAVAGEVRSRYLAERGTTEPPPGFDDHQLFAFGVDRCLYTQTTAHGDPAPRHTVWRSHGP